VRHALERGPAFENQLAGGERGAEASSCRSCRSRARCARRLHKTALASHECSCKGSLGVGLRVVVKDHLEASRRHDQQRPLGRVRRRKLRLCCAHLSKSLISLRSAAMSLRVAALLCRCLTLETLGKTWASRPPRLPGRRPDGLPDREGHGDQQEHSGKIRVITRT
jgi:hypothetical protein